MVFMVLRKSKYQLARQGRAGTRAGYNACSRKQMFVVNVREQNEPSVREMERILSKLL